MNTGRHSVLLGLLLLLFVTPPAQAQEALRQLNRASIAAVSRHSPETEERTMLQSMAEWWGRQKRVLQYLTACGLASASLSYAAIVGIGNPLGGAVLGLVGAGIMVLVCL